MLLGLAVLAKRWHIGPRTGQTVLSQIMAMAVGRHWAYYVISITITVVLPWRPTRPSAGFPILASLVAGTTTSPTCSASGATGRSFGNGILVLSVWPRRCSSPSMATPTP
jgi:hypothetical protein